MQVLAVIPCTAASRRESVVVRSGSVNRASALIRYGGHHADTISETTKATLQQPSRNVQISLRKLGAGERIRTLDPNLGKVVCHLASAQWDNEAGN